jgi:hypothetical protein
MTINDKQIIKKSLTFKTVAFLFQPALVTAHDQRPVELARAPAAPPPRTCPPPGKPLRAFRRRNNAENVFKQVGSDQNGAIPPTGPQGPPVYEKSCQRQKSPATFLIRLNLYFSLLSL